MWNARTAFPARPQNAEKRYSDVNRQLAETRAGTKEDLSAEAVLDGARREAAEGRSLARKVLPGSLDARRETLAKLQRMLQEPAKVGDGRGEGG